MVYSLTQWSYNGHGLFINTVVIIFHGLFINTLVILFHGLFISTVVIIWHGLFINTVVKHFIVYSLIQWSY